MKKRLFAVLVVLVLLLVGVGFYRGWFALSSPSDGNGSNKVNVNLTMDRGKMQDDAQAVQNKTAELTGAVTEKVNGPGELKREVKVNLNNP